MAKEKMRQVYAKCHHCHGTGLYAGGCEPERVAAICWTCGGTGRMTIRYLPFKRRLIDRLVETVTVSRPMTIGDRTLYPGCSLTYREFQKLIKV